MCEPLVCACGWVCVCLRALLLHCHEVLGVEPGQPQVRPAGTRLIGWGRPLITVIGQRHSVVTFTTVAGLAVNWEQLSPHWAVGAGGASDWMAVTQANCQISLNVTTP